MTFRTRLLVVFAVTIVSAVAMVVGIVSASTERAFEQLDRERTAALVQQFQKEFAQRGEEVARAAERIAASETMLRIAVDANRPEPDYSLHVNDASTLATAHGLDFLELVAANGSIASSAPSTARYAYQESWLTEPVDWKTERAFLRREELTNEPALALEAVRVVIAGDNRLYVVAGRRLDQTFLSSLVLPSGMRALLYPNLEPAVSVQPLAGVSPDEGRKLAPLIEKVRQQNREATGEIQWSSDAASGETFHALPLDSRDHRPLGVLLIGSSRRQVVLLTNSIRNVGFVVGGGGILLAVLLAGWATARVTRPVKQLAAGAAEVARGNWDARVEINSRDEIGELARAFNQMTGELSEQRDRLVQAERVAAWRELARRLAHELKNPLFPLQITVENLERAKREHPDQFEEVFRESTATLLAELAKLKTIIGRFSDFAKMPTPQFEPVQLNDLVRAVLKLFDAQFSASGAIRPEVALDPRLPEMQADPEQIQRALQNLVLNAMDAMPDGGALRIQTRQYNNTVILEIADTGQGLTNEECDRLFTPYYTTKHHGTGLGLAIVQSVVSDHGGTISVESQPGRGATFRIELPVSRAASAAGV
ncbi:MAG: integral rane sensor signal transduction histidine kinase [Bryobacterales bacterium]|nr:integral rane sensor signal transduction histidine kinase [Bryobacterales bacterium]